MLILKISSPLFYSIRELTTIDFYTSIPILQKLIYLLYTDFILYSICFLLCVIYIKSLGKYHLNPIK